MTTQFIGGLINLVILGRFIYLSLFISGKLKMRQERQEKFEATMQRRGKLLKVLFYGGTIVFTLLSLKSIFTFINGRHNMVSNIQEKHRQWTKADKDEMTKSCIANAINSYQKDPKRTTALCECVPEKIVSKYTYDQSQKLNKKSELEKMNSLTQLINECIKESSIE